MLASLALALLVAAPTQEAPDRRRVIPAKTTVTGDTLGFQTAQTDYRLVDTIVQASQRTALLFYDHKGPHRGTLLRDVKLVVEPGTLPLDRSYWALRGYDMIDTVLERLEVTGFGKVTERHDEGHAVYLNLAGDFTLRDSWIHHNGGQGLQLVNRPKESSLPSGPAAGTIRVERSRFHENGFNPDRGAFTISIFGTGQDVVLRDVEILAGHDDTVWPKGRTGGGLVIEAEAYKPDRNKIPWWRPAELPADFEAPFTQGRVELENVTIRFRDPSKSLAQIKGCRELVVRGCHFEAEGELEGKIALDHPAKPGRDNGRIVWEGNTGNAVVLYRGERLGPASEDFVIEPEGSGRASESR